MSPSTRVAWPRKLALLVPLVLVNSAAVWGQSGWAYDHITDATWTPDARLAMSLLFAAAVESIGIYLAWEAHSALMANQSSGLLRAGSYAIGLLAGVLNYAHFAGGTYTPTPQAITFGVLSAISPWLWAIRSRSMNRERLAELDMTDERGLKLSTSRKFWHPLRSLSVIRYAAWAGLTKPSEAVARWEASRDGRKNDSPAPVQQLTAVLDEPADLPGDSAGGMTTAVVFSPAERRRLARALKAYDDDMTNDMIAAQLGVSTRTIDRYLNGYGG